MIDSELKCLLDEIVSTLNETDKTVHVLSRLVMTHNARITELENKLTKGEKDETVSNN